MGPRQDWRLEAWRPTVWKKCWPTTTPLRCHRRGQKRRIHPMRQLCTRAVTSICFPSVSPPSLSRLSRLALTEKAIYIHHPLSDAKPRNWRFSPVMSHDRFFRRRMYLKAPRQKWNHLDDEKEQIFFRDDHAQAAGFSVFPFGQRLRKCVVNGDAIVLHDERVIVAFWKCR